MLSIEKAVRVQFPAEMAGIKRASLYRHRNLHVKATQRAIHRMSDAEKMQRRKIDAAKAVVRGDLDPAEYFGAAEIAKDLQRTEGRLQNAAEDAFLTKQHSALSTLSSTLIRGFELRGKLGGSIKDGTEVNLSIAVASVVDKLAPLIESATPTAPPQPEAFSAWLRLPPALSCRSPCRRNPCRQPSRAGATRSRPRRSTTIHPSRSAKLLALPRSRSVPNGPNRVKSLRRSEIPNVRLK